MVVVSANSVAPEREECIEGSFQLPVEVATRAEPFDTPNALNSPTTFLDLGGFLVVGTILGATVYFAVKYIL